MKKPHSKNGTMLTAIRHLRYAVPHLKPIHSKQGNLNDLVRDWNWILRFQTKSTEYSPSRYWKRFLSRSSKWIQRIFLSINDLVLYNDICSVIEALGHQHDPTERCLFIGSSKVSLKVVLLHNGNQFPPVTLVNDANTKQSYENMKLLSKRSSKKKKLEHFWRIRRPLVS
jgi:hypothetical protein